MDQQYKSFFETLGLPEVHVHHPLNHFDFTRSGRVILVVGPMGSGKTGFAAQIWRDSQVALAKDASVVGMTGTGDGADLRRVFFVRSRLDTRRFTQYPADALAYRGGYERLGENIAGIDSSFELEQLVHDHPEVGTWIIDEASFYDERIAYVIRHLAASRGLVFVIPTLILNFRNIIFNTTASLLLEVTNDVFPLTAYCEHSTCLADSNFTYRYYLVDGEECPALFFDPLIIVGGDTRHDDGKEPNYATRCRTHHLLPGKDYTYLVLKPLGEEAARGDLGVLQEELRCLSREPHRSRLAISLRDEFPGTGEQDHLGRNALNVPCLAERALVYLFAEQNLLSEAQLQSLVRELHLDRDFLLGRLVDNRRPVVFKES